MIDPEQTRMMTEAAEAPQVVTRQWSANREIVHQFARTLRDHPPTGVLTCARGSSDHAATYAKYLIETRIGVLVTSAAPSISSVYGEAPGSDGLLAIGISQSGQSPDIVEAMHGIAKHGARTLAMVNVDGSPLAALAGTTLPLHAGPEQSVAATKSYIASLASIARLIAAWSEDDGFHRSLDSLPALLDEAWMADWSPMVTQLANSRGLFVIGRGLGFGIAQEAALKLKETCALHAEAFSAAEVHHGPMALVGPDFPLLVFRQSDEAASSIDKLVTDVRARGGTVLVAGPANDPMTTLPVPVTHPAMEPICAILSFYRAAARLSVGRGLDPDRPRHLSKVTETL